MSASTKARAYIFDGTTCFVPHPSAPHWVKTHPCVAFVRCPTCDAPRFHPCHGTNDVVTLAHVDRQTAAKVLRGSERASMLVRPTTTVLEDEEG